jgi:hypothetical protein
MQRTSSTTAVPSLPRIAHGKVNRRELTETGFVETLKQESEGNFMGLVDLLRDMRASPLIGRSAMDILELPNGLRRYYLLHYRRMKAQYQDLFDRDYKPIVGILAVAQEPVPISHIAAWTKLSANHIKDVVQAWGPFLTTVLSAKGELLYRISHASFQRFLGTQIDLAHYHDIIAQTALDKIPGFSDQPSMDNNPFARLTAYELRHLVGHLEVSARANTLHRLLLTETGAGQNAWYEAKAGLGDCAGYMADIDRAWRRVDTEPLGSRPEVAIGRKCLYALISSSVNSIVGGSPSKTLGTMQRTGGGWERAEALLWLASYLPQPEREQLQRQALDIVLSMKDEWARTQALGGVVPHLQEPEREQAVRQALAAARAIGEKEKRATALAGLAPHLPPIEREEARCEANAIADTIWNVQQRNYVRVGFGFTVPQSMVRRPTGAELTHQSTTGATTSRREKTPGPCSVAWEQAVVEALETDWEIKDASRRAETFAVLAPQLTRFPSALLHSLWTRTLHCLAAYTRTELLASLQALTPVMLSLGGASAVIETRQAIRLVGRWWPEFA